MRSLVEEHTAVGAPQSTGQLLLGAEAIAQLSQVHTTQIELLLSNWERRYNSIEPVIDLEECIELFVQSLHLDMADLFEPAEPF